MQLYIDQVHTNQLNNSEMIKTVISSLEKTVQETTSKMQVVCNIEQNHQMIIKQVHSLYLLMGELSEFTSGQQTSSSEVHQTGLK